MAPVMYWIDPIGDARWADLVARHPQGSVFHTPSWMEALRRTYGYRPIVLTSCSPEDELVDGIPFCEVKSWINGSRLVSLPFSDHCEPLLRNLEDLGGFVEYLRQNFGRSSWEYIELRFAGQTNQDSQNGSVAPKSEGRRHESDPPGLDDAASSFAKYEEYNLQRIDLRSGLEAIFNNFHRSCIRRKIQRAEREGLEYEAGRSESHLKKFYRLLVLTRRRHGLPPQPLRWFRNLMDCFPEDLAIHIASKHDQPIAAILTLLYKSTLVYKYGCSDAAFHMLGAMPMLFWRAIQDGVQQGAEEFDLGRSSMDNPGLSVFKQHLGAANSKLTYLRLGRYCASISTGDSPSRIASTVFTIMPARLAQVAGRVLYRHMG
jgi:CelD/BcsL family acetyltransferase involved in cellulose biosynthesis